MEAKMKILYVRLFQIHICKHKKYHAPISGSLRPAAFLTGVATDTTACDGGDADNDDVDDDDDDDDGDECECGISGA